MYCNQIVFNVYGFYVSILHLGKHTAENIRDCFGNVLETYGITGKISAVLSDNAANMAKAFSVTFPVRYNEETPQLLVDDGELWVSIYCLFSSNGSR